jgi:hypothetical protein
MLLKKDLWNEMDENGWKWVIAMFNYLRNHYENMAKPLNLQGF